MSELEAIERAPPNDVTLPGPGSGIGAYRIIRRLGAGGMGQVFAARREDGGDIVALKQITIIDPTLLYRFKQEFRSLADLSHPNLVRLGELACCRPGWPSTPWNWSKVRAWCVGFVVGRRRAWSRTSIGCATPCVSSLPASRTCTARRGYIAISSPRTSWSPTRVAS
jgi:hypothetical protein